MPAQDRDLTALRRAARRLADSNESGATGFGADGAAGESKVDKVDTFRRCVLTYPEENVLHGESDKKSPNSLYGWYAAVSHNVAQCAQCSEIRAQIFWP